MSKQENLSGTDKCPELFLQILPEADTDCLDETLAAMSGAGFDASAVTGKTLAKLGIAAPDAKLTVVSETSSAGTTPRETPAPKRRFRFRAVWIAACAAVLLLAAVAVAKVIQDKKARVIEVTELKEHLAAERASAFLPLGQSGKLGDITVTAEDMIGDSHRMFIEVSTDVSVDAPDGWLTGFTPADVALAFTCTTGDDYLLADCAAAPFARDGKLWYMVTCADNRDASRTVNNQRVKLVVRNTAETPDASTPLTLSWTNGYNVTDRVIVANQTIGKFRVDTISLTSCDLTVELSGDTAGCTLDYITLTDGSRLYEIANTALPLYPLTELERSFDSDGNLLSEHRYYSLLEGFAAEPGGDAVFVPSAEVTSVTVNGVTIPLR